MRASVVGFGVALVLGSGCNAVFDIGETGPATTLRDSDDDGVFDDADNCVEVENPDQEESDGDALGDACDRCPGVLADDDHDEDLDGRPDSCDDCPSYDDFSDTDVDLDGVGDICDRDKRVSERLRFEPFVTLGPAWQGDGAWEIGSGDTLGPTAPIASDFQGLALTDVTLSGIEWSADLGVVAPRIWEPGDRAGFVARGTSGATTSCTIECTVSECRLTLVVDDVLSSEFVLAREPFLRLRLEVKEFDATTKVRWYTCSAGNLPNLAMTATQAVPIDTAWTPGVIASPLMRITYLDLLQ